LIIKISRSFTYR